MEWKHKTITTCVRLYCKTYKRTVTLCLEQAKDWGTVKVLQGNKRVCRIQKKWKLVFLLCTGFTTQFVHIVLCNRDPSKKFKNWSKSGTYKKHFQKARIWREYEYKNKMFCKAPWIKLPQWLLVPNTKRHWSWIPFSEKFYFLSELSFLADNLNNLSLRNYTTDVIKESHLKM